MKRCLLTAAILTAVSCGLASADYVVVKIDINQLIYTYESKPATKQGVGPGGMPQPGAVPPVMPPNIGKGGKGGKGRVPQYVPPPQPQLGFQPVKPAAPPPDIEPLYVYAYIETTVDPKGHVVQQGNPKGFPFDVWAVDYKIGNQKVKLWLQGMPAVQGMSGELGYWLVKSPAKNFDKKFQDELKDTSDESKKTKFLALAEWALQRGLMNEFNKCIEEVKKVDAKNATVAAVEKVRADLAKRPADEDPAAKTLIDDLQKEEYNSVISDQGHYNLITNIKAAGPATALLKMKLAKLEEVYTTFFYWHAFNGQPLTPPKYRLAVVLVDDAKDFKGKHAVFDFAPMVGSGFSAQRDNVIVYTPRRMDEAFDKLDLVNQKLWNAYNVKDSSELLTHASNLANRRFATDKVALLQTMAVCQKAMSDENEVLTLSHLGVRQLIAATEMLPANVQTAEWARAGLASFFEIPEHSFYPCTGGPNWVHLVEFKHWRKTKKIEPKDAKDVLVKVVTDQYFRQGYGTLKQALMNKEDRASLEQQADEEVKVARATSWSLMHFLVHTKNAQLQRYFEELRSLPRDTDFDGRVLRDCFCRAFGLMTQNPDNPGRQTVDVRKLESLAMAWFASMDSKGLDSVDYEAQAVKWLDASNFQARPPLATLPAAGADSNPGGFPGAPGFPSGGAPPVGGKGGG